MNNTDDLYSMARLAALELKWRKESRLISRTAAQMDRPRVKGRSKRGWTAPKERP